MTDENNVIQYENAGIHSIFKLALAGTLDLSNEWTKMP